MEFFCVFFSPSLSLPFFLYFWAIELVVSQRLQRVQRAAANVRGEGEVSSEKKEKNPAIFLTLSLSVSQYHHPSDWYARLFDRRDLWTESSRGD